MVVNKEGDSPISCPKCSSQWVMLDGNTLTCKCGYRHTVPLKKSYTELERENEQLKKRLDKIKEGSNAK